MTTRVLIVSPPFAGHIYPLIAIAKRLVERGIKPVFATGLAKIPLLVDHGFTAHQLFASDPYAMERIANTDYRVGSNPLLLAKQLSQNLALLPQAKQELTELLSDGNYSAVIADFTAPLAGRLAEEFSLPWITTCPTPFAIETNSSTPSYCGGWLPPQNRFDLVRDATGRLVTRQTKRLFGRLFHQQLSAVGLSLYREDGLESAYSPTSILGLGLAELEYARDWPPAFQMIGPITETPERFDTIPTILIDPRLRVIVTLGTHLKWAKPDLLSQVSLAANMRPDVDFVISWGRASPDPIEVRRLSSNIYCCDYLPYDQVFGSATAVWHQGGAGVTYSTLRAGKPAIVSPKDYDQFDYAARIVNAGAGTWLASGLGRHLEEALDQVLNETYLANCERLAQHVAQTDAPNSAADIIVDLL